MGYSKPPYLLQIVLVWCYTLRKRWEWILKGVHDNGKD